MPKTVALRKESVDRNNIRKIIGSIGPVALRKESVDRNLGDRTVHQVNQQSLSARRAWIEIGVMTFGPGEVFVALRKESVDRNRSALG